jgi:TonB family protein
VRKPRWPEPAAYQAAIQNPHLNLSDPDLRRASPDLTSIGLPKPRSGSSATVFRLTAGGRTWAMRCFLASSDDIQLRYSAITQWLQHVQNDGLFVQATYIEKGILVEGVWLPIVKMDWAEGQPLNVAIESFLNDRAQLESLARNFSDVIGRLLILGMAHGDLQHGNILVSQDRLRLIDYDGIYLPALSSLCASELGHRNYQHPARTEREFSPNLDRFAAIVIYTALRSIIVRPSLWNIYSLDQAGKFKENCLFLRSDFEHPETSRLFEDLTRIPEVAILAERLTYICKMPVRDVPSLKQFVDGTFSASSVTTSHPSHRVASSNTGSSSNGQPKAPSFVPGTPTTNRTPYASPTASSRAATRHPVGLTPTSSISTSAASPRTRGFGKWLAILGAFVIAAALFSRIPHPNTNVDDKARRERERALASWRMRHPLPKNGSYVKTMLTDVAVAPTVHCFTAPTASSAGHERSPNSCYRIGASRFTAKSAFHVLSPAQFATEVQARGEAEQGGYKVVIGYISEYDARYTKAILRSEYLALNEERPRVVPSGSVGRSVNSVSAHTSPPHAGEHRLGMNGQLLKEKAVPSRDKKVELHKSASRPAYSVRATPESAAHIRTPNQIPSEAPTPPRIAVTPQPSPICAIPDVAARVMIPSQPSYPRSEAGTGLSPTVGVSVELNTNGTVRKTSIAQSSGIKGFDSEAIDAATFSKFAGAVRNCVPEDATLLYVVKFTAQ